MKSKILNTTDGHTFDPYSLRIRKLPKGSPKKVKRLHERLKKLSHRIELLEDTRDRVDKEFWDAINLLAGRRS